MRDSRAKCSTRGKCIMTQEGDALAPRERESEVITIYVRSLLSFCADCARPFLSLCFLFLAPRARALRGGERAGGWAESREKGAEDMGKMFG